MKTIFSSRRRHYLARVSIFFILVALIVGMAGCAPPSEDLEIQTWYDLDAVRHNLSGNHTLMNDLDATTAGYEELASPTANQGKGWEPIGDRDNPFTGTFDGQEYQIDDLFINRPTLNPGIGLFSYVDEGGVIENVGMVNIDVTGLLSVGGLVGKNIGGNVSNSYSSGNVTGGGIVGGLVGKNEGTVSNSYSSGNVTGHNDYIGGLVGSNFGTVSNSHSTGSVTGTEWVGGLVGKNIGGNVSNSYSTGNVTGNYCVGGLVGKNEGTVSNSFWDTETSGQGSSDGGTGKLTAEMQDITTFSGATWDIVAVALNETNPTYIWNIVDDETYPFLSWEPVS